MKIKNLNIYRGNQQFADSNIETHLDECIANYDSEHFLVRPVICFVIW